MNSITHIPEGSSFTSVSSFARKARELDSVNQGDWYKTNFWDNSGHYIWMEGYVMQSYAWLYEITGDIYWLNKQIEHIEHVLAQRDNVTGLKDYRGRVSPAWQEKSSQYVWNGFTGAITWPMTSFANVVSRHPELKTAIAPDGRTYAAKAEEFASAAEAALAFHDEDWRESGKEGYYIYAADIPATSIAGQISAYDMNSLMCLSHLQLSEYYRRTGNPKKAARHGDKAEKYAVFFKRNIARHTDSDGKAYYIWPFAEYYGRHADDVGHANFNVLFAYSCYRQQRVFTRKDMTCFGRTFDRLVTDTHQVPHNMIDGTDLENVSKGVFYWHLVSSFDKKLLSKSMGYFSKNSGSLLDLVTIGYVLHEQGKLPE